MLGKITKSTGLWYQVKGEDQKIYACRLRGKFRLTEQRLTNPVAVGDHVNFSLEKNASTGVITEIYTIGKNSVERLTNCKPQDIKYLLHIKLPNKKEPAGWVYIGPLRLKGGGNSHPRHTGQLCDRRDCTKHQYSIDSDDYKADLSYSIAYV